MSSSVNVRSIEAIDDMRVALVRFSGETQEALGAADQEIQRTLDWLAERQNHWQREVDRAQSAIEHARHALTRCQNSGYRNEQGRYHAPDCSAYEQRLIRAQKQLYMAESELRNVQQWKHRVQQATADYQRAARRVATFLECELPKGVASLDKSKAILQSYLETSMPVQGELPVAPGAAPISVHAVRHENQPLTKLDSEEELLSTPGATSLNLPPNTTIELNGYTYETDQLGRVTHVKGQLYLGEAPRRPDLQREVGKLGLPGDEGGHIIGRRFGGSPERANLAPMNAHLNRSSYKKMEEEWARAINRGEHIYVSIRMHYPPAESVRPAVFEARYRILETGKSFVKTFRNRPGG